MRRPATPSGPPSAHSPAAIVSFRDPAVYPERSPPYSPKSIRIFKAGKSSHANQAHSDDSASANSTPVGQSDAYAKADFLAVHFLGQQHSSSHAPHSSSSTPPDGLKVGCIRVLGDDGNYRIVNTANASDAKAILNRVLHKFAIVGEVDKYSLFVASAGSVRQLSDDELVVLAHSTKPERERLVLRKKHIPLTHDDFKRQGTIMHKFRKLENFFGEKLPSGDAQSSKHAAGDSTSKLRNFFGERPPSELISRNLEQFFPNTRADVLEVVKEEGRRRNSTTIQVTRPTGADQVAVLHGIGSLVKENNLVRKSSLNSLNVRNLSEMVVVSPISEESQSPSPTVTNYHLRNFGKMDISDSPSTERTGQEMALASLTTPSTNPIPILPPTLATSQPPPEEEPQEGMFYVNVFTFFPIT